MTSIILSRSLINLRVFRSVKQILSPGCSVTRIPNLQAPSTNFSFVRSKQSSAMLAPQAGQKIDSIFSMIDFEAHRTGRVSRKGVENVLREVKLTKYASGSQSLLLIRCLGGLLTEEPPEVRNKLVQEVWDILKKFNTPLDISHYNALLKVYIENEHGFSPPEFLSNLEQAGIEPNRVTYQRLILQYCRQGDLAGATKILEFMKEKELPINEHVFNSFIIGHARENDMESAHEVLELMKSAGLTPDEETYQNLMVAYAEKGDMEGLDKVMKECESSDILIQNQEYMEVIFALASKGHTQHVSMFIEKLEKVQGYHQMVRNLIYRLLNVGCDEVAYQMYETLSVPQNFDGETSPSGTFFLKHLVKTELYSVATVVQYCQKMKREGLDIYAMERSLEFALSLKRVELSLALMRVIVEDGGTVRPHYFWPLLVHCGSEENKENVYKTISEMVALEVPVTLETSGDYIFPSLLEKNNDVWTVIQQLEETGMKFSKIVNGFVAYYLDKQDISSAVKILSRGNCQIMAALRTKLANAYCKTNDATGAAAILSLMAGEASKDSQVKSMEVGEEGEEVTGGGSFPTDVGGRFLIDVISRLPPNEATASLTAILKAMKERQISISNDTAIHLQSRLGKDSNEDSVNLLNDLSSGELTVQPLVQIPMSQRSIEELEYQLRERETRNLPHSALLSQLLKMYCRQRNVEKAEETLQKMELVLTPAHYALLIDMYASEVLIEKALEIYKQLRQKEPEAKINERKVFKLAEAMLSNGMLEETFRMLEDNAPESYNAENSEGAKWHFYNVLLFNTFVKEGISADVKQRLFDDLIKYNYIKPDGPTCKAVIRAYLDVDDLEGAMNLYEKICQDYKVTAWNKGLMSAFIKTGDTVNLQKIIDLAVPIHGDMNILYDLAFSLIECDKVIEAKKIIQTPGLRTPTAKIEKYCQFLLKKNMITELEHLVKITKDVFDLDRNMMFMYLLKAYKHEKNCDKALSIWTTMQEESTAPSESFLLELGKFLREHKQNVPFAMPSPPQITPQVEVPVAVLKEETPVSPKTVFNKALKERDYDSALKEKTRLEESGTPLPFTSVSLVIEGLIQDSRLGEATELAREVMVSGKFPLLRVMKFLLTNLSFAGNVDAITSLEPHMNAVQKEKVLYYNRLCIAYMHAGRVEEFLEKLLTSPSSTGDDATSVSANFPAGGILAILQHKPEFLPKVSAIADKYASHGITTPASCLWQHYFEEGLLPEAKQVYDKHLKSCEDESKFAHVVKRAYKKKDVNLLPALLEVMNSQQTTPSTKGLVYSCWIDLLTDREKYDEALGVVDGSLRSISLQDYKTTALNKLKDGLSSLNKTFPYTIPEKEVKKNQQTSSSDSSSSSDSDNERKP